MKTTTILKQSFEVDNTFDYKMCIKAIEGQLSDKIFKELINNEKHHLVLNFSIDVVEETEEEKINKDPERAKAMEVIEKLKKLSDEQLEILGFTGYSIWFEAIRINTRLK